MYCLCVVCGGQDCSHGEPQLHQIVPHLETAGSEGVTLAGTVLISAVTRVGLPASCYCGPRSTVAQLCVCLCVFPLMTEIEFFPL